MRDTPANPNTHRLALRTASLALLAAFIALWFGGLDHRKLVEPDEGRYAEVAREMLASGDFVTPRLNGFKHFTKPPMQYWMTALAFRLFGVNEWTARLWTAFTGALGLLVVLFTMRRLFGAQAGLAAVAVLAGSLYYVFFSQVGTIDMGLTLFLTSAMCALMLGLEAPAGSASERNWMRVAWLTMGLAILSKGLIGVVLPLLVAAAYAIAERQWSMWRRLHPVEGTLLMLAVAAPWFVAVSLRNPEFPAFFFVEEHFARYTTGVHRRTQPVWFFLPLVMVGMLPWTWTALEGVRSAWSRAPRAGAFQPGRFVAIWAAGILLFFTFSNAKMPAYVLPAVPAIGMLAGIRLAALDARGVLVRVLPLLAGMGAAIILAGVLAPRSAEAQAYRILYERYAAWLFCAGAAALAASALILALRPSRTRLVASASLASLLVLQLCILGFESMSPLRSSHGIAREIESRMRPDTQVFMVGASYLTLPFYLGQTVLLAQETGQMKFGVRLEPERALLDADRFRAAWAAAPHAIGVMDHRRFDEARAAGMPMQLVCRDDERVLVVKPEDGSAAADGTAIDCVLAAAGR